MNADLERDLVDSDLRALVASLRSAPQARVESDFAARVLAQTRKPRFWSARRLLPLAACLAVVFAFGALMLRSTSRPSVERLVTCQLADGYFSASSSAPYVQAFAVTALARDAGAHAAALDAAVEALVRSQSAAGGWANAALSARNTAALSIAAAAGVPAAQTAYRRALRYLRVHGIGELSADDLSREARLVCARLASTADKGLACSASLCATL